MINFISSWTKSIILAIIISIILEMILPNGNNRKYIKTVIGIYILFTIIAPVISKVNGGKIDIDLSKYQNYFNSQIQTTSTDSVDINFDNTYISGLKTDIKQKLKEKGYEVNKLDLEIELNNKEQYGSIKKINLSLSKKNDSTVVNAIEKIEVKITNEIKENSVSSLTVLEKTEVKKFLKETYDISENDIDIGG